MAVILSSLLMLSSAYADEDSVLKQGEAIYLHGMLGPGQPLEGSREQGMHIEGKDAACVNCHRRSGLGSKEGLISIPPVTGRYLYLRRTPDAEDLEVPYLENMRVGREPYTDATVARAIRDGIGPEGKPLSYLMPHFNLGDADMAALIAYLKHLDRPEEVAGVSESELHFATIITPDADPVKRKGMLAVLNQFFTDKNAFPIGNTPPLRTSHKWHFMVNRRWQLHVWQLHGPAATWQAQLNEDFAREPVLAVISGLGGKNWAPVHAFCERREIPCLFPNVEAPPERADHDFYSLYFSKGVELEAGLIANRILNPDDGHGVKVVHQIYRAGDSGEAGARALTVALEQQGIEVKNDVLPGGKAGKGVGKAVRKDAHADALVLWLRPPDIAALQHAPPPPKTVFISGLMGGLDRLPLPAAWHDRARISYPFALPEQRRVNVDYAFGWFNIRRIPVVAEQVQADTFLACGLLAETLKHAGDIFEPDFLIERVEDMIDHRIVTGYYPHLTLAPGQRFASKGGYIARFADPDSNKLLADGGWVVP